MQRSERAREGSRLNDTFESCSQQNRCLRLSMTLVYLCAANLTATVKSVSIEYASIWC